ncbi:MAG: esterase/lipase family protein [Trueperaceae bacterium]
MTRPPVLFVHGYSSGPGAFDGWRRILRAHGRDPARLIDVHYESLVHAVSLTDVGEAFAHAIAADARLAPEEPFDALVHSTGMLVVRAWMALDPARHRRRLRHLIALAPATFGSPLAHKGRGYVGKLLVGNRDLGPDFLAVGDEVLDGLELGSRFTWDLAHHDLVGPRAEALRDLPGPRTFVLCGIDGFRGLKGLANEPGTDGAVRLAGAALNTRKVALDLTLDADAGRDAERTVTAPWSVPDVPLVALAGLNHGTLLSEPTAKAVDLVVRALDVADDAEYAAWNQGATAHGARVLQLAQRRSRPLGRWQQLVVRVVDERGDAVPDYYLDFVHRPPRARRWKVIEGVRMHVHPYGRDPSLRCFHLDLDSFRLPEATTVGLRLLAHTGSSRVRYRGYASASLVMHASVESAAESSVWTAALDLSRLEKIELFYPFTTTLVALTIDREPVVDAVVRLAAP